MGYYIFAFMQFLDLKWKILNQRLSFFFLFQPHPKKTKTVEFNIDLKRSLTPLGLLLLRSLLSCYQTCSRYTYQYQWNNPIYLRSLLFGILYCNMWEIFLCYVGK